MDRLTGTVTYRGYLSHWVSFTSLFSLFLFLALYLSFHPDASPPPLPIGLGRCYFSNSQPVAAWACSPFLFALPHLFLLLSALSPQTWGYLSNSETKHIPLQLSFFPPKSFHSSPFPVSHLFLHSFRLGAISQKSGQRSPSSAVPLCTIPPTLSSFYSD